MSKGRILSGARPSGKLHLGNLEGALRNWAALQDDYECFFEVADWHALTTGYANTSDLQQNLLDFCIDWLSVGIDPERSTVFIQSLVPEHAELHLLLSMIVPVPWLERNPTYKEWQENLQGGEESIGYGLLGYPVLQAADIVIYKADTVPVGRDQLPHLELTREIVRRFNNLYGEVLVEPEAMLTAAPLLRGIDGRKMSKSYNNEIRLADDAEAVTKKIRSMYTDELKLRRGDPGRPEQCPVFDLHKLYNVAESDPIATDCRSGALGCVDCKRRLTEKLNVVLDPVREKRRELEAEPVQVQEIFRAGSKKAREVAAETLGEIRDAMGVAVPMPVGSSCA